MHLNDTVRMSTRRVKTPQEVLFRAGRHWAITDNSHVKKVAHESTWYGDVATYRGRTLQSCAGSRAGRSSREAVLWPTEVTHRQQRLPQVRQDGRHEAVHR